MTTNFKEKFCIFLSNNKDIIKEMCEYKLFCEGSIILTLLDEIKIEYYNDNVFITLVKNASNPVYIDKNLVPFVLELFSGYFVHEIILSTNLTDFCKVVEFLENQYNFSDDLQKSIILLDMICKMFNIMPEDFTKFSKYMETSNSLGEKINPNEELIHKTLYGTKDKILVHKIQCKDKDEFSEKLFSFMSKICHDIIKQTDGLNSEENEE